MDGMGSDILMKVVIWGGIVIVCSAAGIMAMVQKIMTPTRGEAIPAYSAPRKALLVLDVQEDLISGEKGSKLKPQPGSRLVEKINGIIDQAATENMIVVYIRHLCPDSFLYRIAYGGMLVEGKPGSAFSKELKIVSEYDMPKAMADGFSNPALDVLLREAEVDTLYLVGIDGAQCVLKTALGGRNRGYHICMLMDGIGTFQNKSLDELSNLYQKLGMESRYGGEIV